MRIKNVTISSQLVGYFLCARWSFKLNNAPSQRGVEARTYRVNHQDGKNILLTQFQQLVGRYSSYLLTWQDGGTPQIIENGRVFTVLTGHPVPNECVIG